MENIGILMPSQQFPQVIPIYYILDLQDNYKWKELTN